MARQKERAIWNDRNYLEGQVHAFHRLRVWVTDGHLRSFQARFALRGGKGEFSEGSGAAGFTEGSSEFTEG
eukprot:7220336-Pyramimonas_sp.AAC.1